MPDAPEPLFRLCALLLGEGDPSANALLARLEVFRGYAPGWRYLGEALLVSHQAEAALVGFARALAADPDFAAAQFGLGRALRLTGRLPAAGEALQRAVTLDPALAQAWFTLGLVRQDLHDPAGAVTAYRSALEAEPSLHEAAFNLGVACQEVGDLDAALAAYAMALRLRPEALGRIAHALTSSPTGCLFLSLDALRKTLGGF